jgi:endonuclease III
MNEELLKDATSINPDWRLYGDIDLIKSCAEENEQDDWMIYGMALNEVEDITGETPILKSMDWSYFDKQGFMKYEHDVGRPTPINIIGVPHERKSLGKGEFIKAMLLEGQPQAEETRRLIKALRKHNEKFPEKKRTLGYSIEGKYLGMSKSAKYWGKVINLVVTPNPLDLTTWAEMKKAHNLELMKSLSTGYGTSPETQKGGGALRKESVASGVKSKTINGDKRMKEFKDFEEALDFYKSEGFSDKDAETEARKLFPENNDDVKKSFQEILNRSLEPLRKTIESIGLTRNKSAEELKKLDNPVESENDKDGNDEENFTDVTPFFTAMVKSVNNLAEQQDGTTEALAKTMGHFADGLEILSKGIETRLVEMEKAIDQQNKLLKAIGKTSMGISFANLNSEQVVKDGGNGNMNKSQILNKLIEKSQKGEIPSILVTEYEVSGQLPVGCEDILQ